MASNYYEWDNKTLKGELMTLSAGVPASAALNALNMVGKQLALMSVEKDVMAEVLAARDLAIKQSGGGCGCMTKVVGGYRPTRKNRAALKKWKQGKSIGFTMRASLKAKGLIPRNSRKNKGKKIVSNKYK